MVPLFLKSFDEKTLTKSIYSRLFALSYYCMCKKVFAHANNIYEIDVSFFVKAGVKTLILDLDNTLDSYRLYHPSPRAYELMDKLHAAGINTVIISNNRGKRVSSYANDLKIPYIWSARKPFPGKIKKFIKDNNLNKEEVMLVGDQLMTDVTAANKAKIRVVLTEKLVKEDQWTTHINRIFDRPIRFIMRKRGKLPDWRTIYG